MTVALAPKDELLEAERPGFGARAHLRTVLAALVVSVAYYLGAKIGFALKFRSTPISIFWLPNATMFAVFLLAPPRRWWIYVLAALPAHLAAQIENGTPPLMVSLWFLTNLADGAIGAYVIRRLSGRRTPTLDGLRSMLVFFVGAIGVPLFVSFFDAGAVVLTGFGDDFGLVWRARFRSNVLTNVVLIPAVVLAATRGRSWIRGFPLRRTVEAVLLTASLLVVGNLVVGESSIGSDELTALLYLPLPLLAWAAFRFGTGGVSVSLVIFAFLVIWNAAHGYGPFAGPSPSGDVRTIQVFLTLLSVGSLVLGGLLEERRRAAIDLAEREAQYRSIFEATGDGVLITDLAQTVVAANPAFYRLTGYSAGKLRATPPQRIFHLDDQQPFGAYLARASTSDETNARAICVREDGGLSLFAIHGRRFSYGGLPHVLSVVRDVTEHERAYRELEHSVAERTRTLSSVLEISKTVASTLEIKPLVRIVLDHLASLVAYTSATIFIREEDDGELTILDHKGPLTPDQLAEARISSAEAMRCRVLIDTVPIVIGDLTGDNPAAVACREQTPEIVRRLFTHARSLMLIPLVARDRTIGLLRIDHNETNRYTTQHAELALTLASQAAIAIENTRLYERARELAALEERQHLARELHDSVTQTLCAVAMLGKILPETWTRSPEAGRETLTSLDEMTQSALAEMRTLLLELRPDTLREGNLGELLHQLAEALRSRVRAPVRVHVEGYARLPPDVQIAFYRVAQEALSNTGKHASAPSVSVELHYSETAATLTIHDDGVGFTPDEIPPGHLGTLLMRERVLSVGAALSIDSAPGQGTTVTVVWPNPELGAAPPIGATAPRLDSSR